MEQLDEEEENEGEAAPTETTPETEDVDVADSEDWEDVTAATVGLRISDKLECCGFCVGANGWLLFASVLLNGIGLILWTTSPCGNDSDCRLKNRWCFLRGPILAWL